MFFDLFKPKKKEAEPVQIRLVYDRKQPPTKTNIINYFKSLGIDVHTNTKARGNSGIYIKNRIDIMKGLNEKRATEVLVHEFAHHIHSQIDKDFNKNGGSLETLFNTKDISIIKNELIKTMYFVDKNSKLDSFFSAKTDVAEKIKGMQKTIKNDYPNFARSKRFPEFERYIKNSDAKYLVKYDAIRLKKGFMIKKDTVYTVKNLDKDFPDIPKAFSLYIKLCSLKRKQSRIARHINKYKKYFEKPTELFARFVQGYFSDRDNITVIAPVTVKTFNDLLNKGYYGKLKDFFEIFTA